VEAFEREFADYCGVSHCVGVASGTAALTIAIQAAGIERGAEVIVPGHTFIASVLGVIHAGAVPVFCEVEEATGLIDPDAVAAAVTARTAAILPVHLYGQACRMDVVAEIARRHSLAIVEDAAQAHGATYRGRRAGSLGTAAAFSFYPSKNLGALGDGGAICTDDDWLATRARQLRNLGQQRKGEHEVIGYNERLDGLQAALLRVKLPHLDRWNARRREHADAYSAALAGHLELTAERPDSPSVHHLYAVRSAARDRLAQALGRQNVQVGIHYTPAAHRHPAIVQSRGDLGNLPVSERWAKEQLSLPMFAELEDDEVRRASEVILNCVENLAIQ